MVRVVFIWGARHSYWFIGRNQKTYRRLTDVKFKVHKSMHYHTIQI